MSGHWRKAPRYSGTILVNASFECARLREAFYGPNKPKMLQVVMSLRSTFDEDEDEDVECDGGPTFI